MNAKGEIVMRDCRQPRSRLLELCIFIEGRIFEFASSFILLGLAFHLQIWPNSVSAGSFHELVHYINPSLLGVFFGLFGALRLSALIANGTWYVIGPWLRAIGALAAAMMFGNMVGSLYQYDLLMSLPPSPEIPVYSVLALFELISMYRALALVGKRNGSRD